MVKNKAYAGWYEKNKSALAERRAQKYHNDPEYRKKVIERARLYRMSRKGETVPPGYAHHMAGAAEVLGITIWTLREWRKKDYFPEPYEFKGRKWFTADQIGLLTKLKDFFVTHGIRTSRATRGELDALVGLIYANWQE